MLRRLRNERELHGNLLDKRSIGRLSLVRARECPADIVFPLVIKTQDSASVEHLKGEENREPAQLEGIRSDCIEGARLRIERCNKPLRKPRQSTRVALRRDSRLRVVRG